MNHVRANVICTPVTVLVYDGCGSLSVTDRCRRLAKS